jgi:two-component system cell cycle response regulator CtrA
VKVLIIEDDRMVAHTLQLLLTADGIRYETTNLGEEGIQMCQFYDGNFDLIILDVMLPDINGLEVLLRLRHSKITTPVMILSGLCQPENKVKGLDIGADDYITKPFDPDELLARIHAIVRRSKGFSESTITIDSIVINIDTRTVSVDGKSLHLTSKEYAILELLAMRKGTVLTKEMFLNHLYNGVDEPELKIIDVFVCKLRKKLSDAAGGKNYIETVWGRGYMLRETPAEELLDDRLRESREERQNDKIKAD